MVDFNVLARGHSSPSGTYRSGVGVVAGGVANHAVANQTVPWKQEGVAHRRQQDFFGLRKQPFDGDVTEYRRHGFLQRLYHLCGKEKAN